MIEFKFENGIKVKDLVTGITGIIVARMDYLTGCNRYAVQPAVKKGADTVPEWIYFDENIIKRVGSTKVKATDDNKQAAKKGGFKPDQQRQNR